MRHLTALALLISGCAQSATAAIGDCASPDEIELARLVNEYRVSVGRSSLPVSRWLGTTGQWHVYDLINNDPTGGVCNLHSWSNARPDLWQGMCYTADHAQAAQMWAKPSQISQGRYVGNGFELAHVAFPQPTPESALIGWQNSPAHNAVITQTGVWAGVTFTALGTGMLGTVAVLWFGDGFDPDGLMAPCSVDAVLADGFEGN